LVYW